MTRSRLSRFEVVEGDESLTSHSGLALVGCLLEHCGLRDCCDRVDGSIPLRGSFSAGSLAVAMTGLICLGDPDFDAIEEQREQPFFAQSLGLAQCPSSPTLRQRLHAMGSSLDGAIRLSSQQLIQDFAPHISGVDTAIGEMIPIDMDVSVFDNSNTKREGIGYTYQKVVGYSPIFSHLGKEGYLIDAELRPGEEHSQSERTPDFLRQTIAGARRMLKGNDHRPFVLRLDAGFDSGENLHLCDEESVYYIIARNLRRESHEEWLAIAQSQGPATSPRPGKREWVGMIQREKDGQMRTIAYKVIERTTKINGTHEQPLLFPDIEVSTFWTNIPDEPQIILPIYRQRGTSEQFHGEFKTDMHMERLPSGTFDTNQLILLLGMISYNALRIIGQQSLQSLKRHPSLHRAHRRKKVERRRIRSVMDDFIRMASRLCFSGRQWKLSLGKHCPFATIWKDLYALFHPHPRPVITC